MLRIGDLIDTASPKQLSIELQRKADQLDKEADKIWKRIELGDACRVFPGLLRCTARQIRILDAGSKLPVEVAAGACRTTFEVNVRARLAVADPSYLMRLQLELVSDEQSLLKAFLKLAGPDGSVSNKAILEDRLLQIQSILDRRGLSPEKNDTVANNARRAGVFDEYDTLYRFYSKYVHGSGWLTLATDDMRDGADYRNIFTVQAQIYAGDTLVRISDAIIKLTKS